MFFFSIVPSMHITGCACRQIVARKQQTNKLVILGFTEQLSSNEISQNPVFHTTYVSFSILSSFSSPNNMSCTISLIRNPWNFNYIRIATPLICLQNVFKKSFSASFRWNLRAKKVQFSQRRRCALICVLANCSYLLFPTKVSLKKILPP